MKVSKKEGHIRKSTNVKSPEASELCLNFYDPFEVKHRQRTSSNQLKTLEKEFLNNPKPSKNQRQALAESLSMSPRGIQVWFQNRRAKAKQQTQPRDDHQDHKFNSSCPILPPTNMVHSRSQSSSTDSSWHSDLPAHMILPTRPDELQCSYSSEELSTSLSLSPSSTIDKNSILSNFNEWWPMAAMAGNMDPLMTRDLADSWAYDSLQSKDDTHLLASESSPLLIMSHERLVSTRPLDDSVFLQRHVDDWIQTVTLPIFHTIFGQAIPSGLDEAYEQFFEDCAPSFRA